MWSWPENTPLPLGDGDHMNAQQARKLSLGQLELRARASDLLCGHSEADSRRTAPTVNKQST